MRSFLCVSFLTLFFLLQISTFSLALANTEVVEPPLPTGGNESNSGPDNLPPLDPSTPATTPSENNSNGNSTSNTSGSANVEASGSLDGRSGVQSSSNSTTGGGVSGSLGAITIPNTGGVVRLNDTCSFAKDKKYCLLAPITGFIGDNNGKLEIDENGLSEYLNNLFRFGIALAGALTVIMIITGGLQYLASDVVFQKGAGKTRIQNALLGLGIALSSWLLLNTINPDLLDTTIKVNGTAIKDLDVKPITDINGNIVVIPGGGVSGAIGGGISGTGVQPTPYTGGFNPALNGVAMSPTATLATNFGYRDSEDNGVGSPLLTGISGVGILTNDPNVQGISLPMSVLENTFSLSGNRTFSSWEVVRNSAVEVTGPNGQTLILPIVDIGPGGGAAPGVGADLTYGASQTLGTGGKGQISYRILPGYYESHPKPQLTTVPAP